MATLPPLNVDLSGKIALVTGATGGIGKEVARGLARLGATVIIGARNASRGEAALADISKTVPNAKVSVMTLDMASFASIRSFVSTFGQKYEQLNILVNNAGVWYTERQESADGYEGIFATNVLGPHLLNSLLVPKLKAGAPARIVNVVSSFASNYDVEDLEFKKRKFNGFQAYGQSKQAFRMSTWGLAGRLNPSEITVNAAAPGFVKTDFNQNAKGFMATMINLSAKLFAVTPEVGADTVVWAAAAPELNGVSGKYFEGRKEKDGKFHEPGPIAELDKKCDQMIASKSN
jgi:NAD(P)-dependent dehydrogenase (short-subunit alcohol dehydrogenase family)